MRDSSEQRNTNEYPLPHFEKLISLIGLCEKYYTTMARFHETVGHLSRSLVVLKTMCGANRYAELHLIHLYLKRAILPSCTVPKAAYRSPTVFPLTQAILFMQPKALKFYFLQTGALFHCPAAAYLHSVCTAIAFIRLVSGLKRLPTLLWAFKCFKNFLFIIQSETRNIYIFDYKLESMGNLLL